MAEKDSLNQRVGEGILFDNYGAQLTKKQRLACEMILTQDLSLSEAAQRLGVSRQGVHDLITRAREQMEEYEKSFGLVAHRRQMDKMEQMLEDNRERLPEEFYATLKKILEA